MTVSALQLVFVILAVASSFANKLDFFLPSLLLAHNARGQGCLASTRPQGLTQKAENKSLRADLLRQSSPAQGWSHLP